MPGKKGLTWSGGNEIGHWWGPRAVSGSQSPPWLLMVTRMWSFMGSSRILYCLILCRACWVLVSLIWEENQSGFREGIDEWQSVDWWPSLLGLEFYFFLLLQIGSWKGLLKFYQRSNLRPLHWKHEVLTTRSLGKSFSRLILTSTESCWVSWTRIEKIESTSCILPFSHFWFQAGCSWGLSGPREGGGGESGRHQMKTVLLGSWWGPNFWRLVYSLGDRIGSSWGSEHHWTWQNEHSNSLVHASPPSGRHTLSNSPVSS